MYFRATVKYYPVSAFEIHHFQDAIPGQEQPSGELHLEADFLPLQPLPFYAEDLLSLTCLHAVNQVGDCLWSKCRVSMTSGKWAIGAE